MSIKNITTKTLLLILIFSVLTAQAFVKVIAHRGASLEAPENTIAAFQKAIEIGADYIELDVYTTVDDSMVIMHDNTVNRMTNGTGEIKKLTFKYIRNLSIIGGGQVPTLSEALNVAKGKIKVCIEMKSASMPKVLYKIKMHEMTDEVILFNFNYPQLQEGNLIDPTQDALLLVGDFLTADVDKLATINGEAIGGSGGETVPFITYAHQKGIEVWRWTVNDVASMTYLINMGIDGIITDDPRSLIGVLQGMDGSPPSAAVMNKPVVSDMDVSLSWSAASDAQTGVMGYIVYAGENNPPNAVYKKVENVTTLTHVLPKKNTKYYYRIKAINGSRLTSGFSNVVSAISEPDIISPELINVTSSGSANKVVVMFSEAITKGPAETLTNYTIAKDLSVTAKVSGSTLDDAISIDSAILSGDLKTVFLTTSDLEQGASYTLSVNNITDTAFVPNTIADGTEWTFIHTKYLPGLVAFWGFNEGQGDSTRDYSMNMNNLGVDGPEWISGKEGMALSFDGETDTVFVPTTDSLSIQTKGVSISVWVNLAQLPSELSTDYARIVASDKNSYVLYEDAKTKELCFRVSTVEGFSRPGIASANLVKDEWIHIAGVYEEGAASIYLNGELMDTHKGIEGAVALSTVTQLGGFKGDYYSGSIDELKIFNRGLTPYEVERLYNRKVTSAFTKTLVMRPSLRITPNPVQKHSQIRLEGRYNKGIPGSLSVHNINGQVVKNWHIDTNNEQRFVPWDGTDMNNNRLSPGIYFVSFSQGKMMMTECVVVE
ncbi:MAG: T9SS type A sorting domain-containing protein [Fibrobacteria bacterium]|nr:T9SS type A sorting domain-containing protein [Fibrobacteria bacterium]